MAEENYLGGVEVFNKFFVLLLLAMLALAGLPTARAGGISVASMPVGVVTKSACMMRNRGEECTITTSHNREFLASTAYTDIARKGTELLLVIVGPEGQDINKALCNSKDRGVCARVISEKVR